MCLASYQDFFIGHSFKSVERYAKYLWFTLSNNSVMLAHQRFTGFFAVPVPNLPTRVHSLNASQKHVRVKWTFADEQEPKDLAYTDPRCLAVIKLLPPCSPEDVPEVNALGNDPLKCIHERKPHDLGYPGALTMKEYLDAIRKKPKWDIKTVLLDQRVVFCGLGNHLVSNLLNFTEINPWKKVGDMSVEELKKIYFAVYDIVNLADHREDYSWFPIFRQKQCKGCNGPAYRLVHRPGKKDPTKGRSTYFCPTCQDVDISTMMKDRGLTEPPVVRGIKTDYPTVDAPRVYSADDLIPPLL